MGDTYEVFCGHCDSWNTVSKSYSYGAGTDGRLYEEAAGFCDGCGVHLTLEVSYDD